MKWKCLLATLLAAAALAGCGHPFVVGTPQGFVDLGDNYPDGEYRATTADGVVIGIRAWKNKPRGELAFWARALERRMRELGGYALLDKQDVATRAGLRGVQMRLGHDEGKTPYLYVVAIFVTEKKVYVFEAGGTKDEMTKQEASIRLAMDSLGPK